MFIFSMISLATMNGIWKHIYNYWWIYNFKKTSSTWSSALCLIRTHQFHILFPKKDINSITSDENTNNQPNYNWISHNVDGIEEDCSNSIANALELLQSCTKPLIYMQINSEHIWLCWSIELKLSDSTYFPCDSNTWLGLVSSWAHLNRVSLYS